MKQIEMLLPEVYSQQIRPQDWNGLEELRFCHGSPVYLRYGDREQELWPQTDAFMVEEIIQRACQHSAYAHADTIRQGYITVEGGHRIGICGLGITEAGIVRGIKEPGSLNIRIAKQVLGCAEKLFSEIRDSMLIVGPPGSGKTTLLRDVVRLLSDRRKQRVGLADERGELSAAVNGRTQMNVGLRTDVLVNVPKSIAVMMLLRTMNPTWIAVDEITAAEDIAAMEQASYCGVKLLATAHGDSAEDLKNRPLYRKLMETGIFQQVVVLRRDKSYEIQEAVF